MLYKQNNFPASSSCSPGECRQGHGHSRGCWHGWDLALGVPNVPSFPFLVPPPSCSDVDSKDKSRSHGSAELLGGREVWQECCLGRREGGTEIIYFPGNGFAPRRVKPRRRARLWTTQACRAARDPAPRWRLGCSRTPDSSPRGAG